MSRFINCYTKRRYGECRILFVVILNVVMLSVMAPAFVHVDIKTVLETLFLLIIIKKSIRSI